MLLFVERALLTHYISFHLILFCIHSCVFSDWMLKTWVWSLQMDAQSFSVSHQYQTQCLLRLSLLPETCSTAVKVNIRNVYYLSCYPYSLEICVLGLFVFYNLNNGCMFLMPSSAFLNLSHGGRLCSCCLVSHLEQCLWFLKVSMYITFWGHPKFP